MDWTRVALAALSGGIAAVIASIIVKKPREHRLFHVVVTGAVFLGLVSLSNSFLLPFVRDWQTTAQGQKALKRDWRTYRIGDSGLSLSLPGPLVAQNVNIPNDVKLQTSSLTISSYEADGIYIAASHVAYLPSIAADLDGAISGAISNMSRESKNARISHSQEPTTIDGRTGAVVNFDINAKNERLAGKGLFLTEGNQAWSVIVLFKPDHPVGTQFATKTISSAHFDRSVR